jgi:uncharacterized membrane protein
MDKLEKWIRVYQVLVANKRLLGALIGLLFGILYLIFGLAKTLVFVFFVLVGFLAGHFLDEREDWRDVIDKLLPPKYRE